MAAKHKTTLEKSERQMVFTRTFDAPRELVWKAWTDPEQLAKWWGPNGFSMTTHEMQFREGGFWKLILHGPDGRDYKNKILYLEITKPQRLIFKHAGEKEDEPVSFTTTVTFEAVAANETKVTMVQLFNKSEDLQFVVENYGADKGGIQTFERLADYMIKPAAAA